jgi:hypothetical protein
MLTVLYHVPAIFSVFHSVHIRRTDKLLSEGSYYAVKSYFKYVEEYFKKLQAAGIEAHPKVYLATDDPEVLIEATERLYILHLVIVLTQPGSD